MRELRRIDPAAFPELEEVELENHLSVLVVKVPGGASRFRICNIPAGCFA